MSHLRHVASSSSFLLSVPSRAKSSITQANGSSVPSDSWLLLLYPACFIAYVTSYDISNLLYPWFGLSLLPVVQMPLSCFLLMLLSFRLLQVLLMKLPSLYSPLSFLQIPSMAEIKLPDFAAWHNSVLPWLCFFFLTPAALHIQPGSLLPMPPSFSKLCNPFLIACPLRSLFMMHSFLQAL